jgi:hypothetical protein
MAQKKYRFKNFVPFLDRNKDRIGTLIGILGFAATIYALYDTRNANEKNYILNKQNFDLQDLIHREDSEETALQLKLNAPAITVSIEDIENHAIKTDFYNDGKRDAFLKGFNLYLVGVAKDTILSTVN